MQKLVRAALRIVRHLLAITVASCAVVHFTIRDSTFLAVYLFYPSPKVVLTLATFGISLLYQWSDARVTRYVWRVVAAVFLAATLLNEFGWHVLATDKADSVIRVATWNVKFGQWSTADELALEITGTDADIIALVEAPSSTPREREFWSAKFPNYSVIALGEGLVIAVRGTVNYQGYDRLAQGGRLRRLAVNIRGEEISVGLIDIFNSFRYPRQQAFDRLNELLPTFQDRPSILLGDFNTPTNSICFGKLREGWSNAVEVAGCGYSPTWPIPVPVLTIDQIWGNDKVRFESASARWTLRSDHRPVVTDLRLTQ